MHRTGLEEWVVEFEAQAFRFIESGVSPICPLCGGPLLWPTELIEGTSPTTPEERERLTLWFSSLPE
ncbi:hypothetical protein [Thermoflexus sp.]|uniref:hypothetical protein n=1 Tax=Thermoflexus sp. TaxID=1969742 RepID=UPI0035E40A93